MSTDTDDFCEHVLSWEAIPLEQHRHFGVLLLVLGLLYGIATIFTLYWIKLQERAAKQGHSGAAKNVIFPAFVVCMYLGCFTDLLVGVAIFVAAVDPTSVHSLTVGVVYSLSWALQHVVIEGIAFMLMEYGCGFKAARRAFIRSVLWGCVTFVLLSVSIFFASQTASLLMLVIWSTILLLFYSTLWLAPQRVFRRPSCIYYARFWALFRICVLAANLMEFFPVTSASGNCTYVFGSLFLFCIAKPLIIYWTLIRDSEWWQGFGADDDGRENNHLKSPLLGVDLPLFNAQQLADSIDRLQFSVRRLNFAYIQLDKTNLLGEGSSSRVYRAAYKGRPCAVKMLFTLDLTPEVINRCCTEATILSNIRHKNVVNIWGVSVLPPSVCIVLELCRYGSLSDVLRGKVQSDGSYGKDPPFNLSWTDKLHLALGCARGLAALHELDGNIVHRDVKSFNFLVDDQLNTKIADLELGAEQNVFDSSPSVSPSTSTKIWRMSFTTSALNASENALANWLAPEVLRGASHSQASDVYSLGLVLYEIVTGLLPFAECKNQAAVRAANSSGKQPSIPSYLPEEYTKIILACWSHNPTERPTSSEVAEDLFIQWQYSVHRVVKFVDHQLQPEMFPRVSQSQTITSPSVLKRLARAFSFTKDRGLPSTEDHLSMSLHFDTQWSMLDEDKRPFIVMNGSDIKWIVHCTGSFTQITGYLPYDVLGRELDLFMGPLTDRSVVRDMIQAMEVVHHAHAVWNLYRKDDTWFLCSVHVYPIYANTEDAKGVILEAMFDPAHESARSSASSQHHLALPDIMKPKPTYFILLVNVLQEHWET